MEMFELKQKQEAQIEKLKGRNRELKQESEAERKRGEEGLMVFFEKARAFQSNNVETPPGVLQFR
jgi:hypothetical protein